MKRRTPQQFAEFVTQMMLANPAGFRTPRLDGRGLETLMERAAKGARMVGDDYVPSLSMRSEKKRARKKLYLKALAKERRLRDAYRAIPGVSNFAPVAPKGFEAQL